MTRLLCLVLLPVLATAASASDGVALNVGPIVSNLAPVDSAYSDRFLTPGTAAGLVVDVDTPGVLGFRITGEYFWKNSSPSGWDGEIDPLPQGGSHKLAGALFDSLRSPAPAGLRCIHP